MLDLSDPVVRVLEIIGVTAFAISGALLAVRKRFDLVGMAVLAMATALGGGVLRDLILGATPPAAFTNVVYLVPPLVVSLIVLWWHPVLERTTRVLMVFDAAGLGLFCVTGTVKALEFGLGPVQAVLLGVTTAVGGGVVRDLLAGEIPTVLRHGSELYVIPALLGATVVVLADLADGPATPTAVSAAVLAFVLRMLAMRYHWRAPVPRGTTSD
ncbi:trimeric intracellular cation channel family protein [Nocardioides limicola]|uniref:trimeric intracellular cation channel family protein n=1 Tax=Nocardioides limicola TaxID=2803368 RepID=UPI0027DDD8F2|nr:trimeric intracellular cation channel family protein [Nocardioides sp. DJM-14]